MKQEVHPVRVRDMEKRPQAEREREKYPGFFLIPSISCGLALAF